LDDLNDVLYLVMFSLPSIKYVRNQDVIVAGINCFDCFSDLKTFVENAQNDEDLKSASVTSGSNTFRRT
jgi:hypothetical protein